MYMDGRRKGDFENGLAGKVFWPKKDEVIGEWIRLHKKDPSYLYFTPNIIPDMKLRRMRWAGHVAQMGNNRDAPILSVGRTDDTRKFIRTTQIEKDNFNMYFQEVGSMHIIY
jgi:hypothetical protein